MKKPAEYLLAGWRLILKTLIILLGMLIVTLTFLGWGYEDAKEYWRWLIQ